MILVKCVFVAVEASQFASARSSVFLAIHRSILLVAEDDFLTGLALSGSFRTLTTDGFDFVAFKLSLSTGLATEA